MSEVPWLDAINIGDTFFSEEEIEVTEEEIMAFAELYDPQPGHLSQETALSTGFAGLAASGWHTAAMTMQLLCQIGFVDTIGLDVCLAWPTPTRPGDRLRLQGRITSKRESASRPGTGILGIQYETLNQDGEIRQSTKATLMAQSSFSVSLQREYCLEDSENQVA